MAVLTKVMYSVEIERGAGKETIAVGVEPGTITQELTQIVQNLPGNVTALHGVNRMGDLFVVHNATIN